VPGLVQFLRDFRTGGASPDDQDRAGGSCRGFRYSREWICMIPLGSDALHAGIDGF
jgi:hypothetical protein